MKQTIVFVVLLILCFGSVIWQSSIQKQKNKESERTTIRIKTRVTNHLSWSDGTTTYYIGTNNSGYGIAAGLRNTSNIYNDGDSIQITITKIK